MPPPFAELGPCCMACGGLRQCYSSASWVLGLQAHTTMIFPDSTGDGAQYPVPTHKSPASELHPSLSGFFLNACIGHVTMSMGGSSGKTCSPWLYPLLAWVILVFKCIQFSQARGT